MSRWLPSVLLVIGTALVLSAQGRPSKAPKRLPNAVPAGPAWLTAGSTIPGQIWLSFSWVPNAQRYRVTRSRSRDVGGPERTIYEGEAEAFGHEDPAGTYHDAPVDLVGRYWYKVYAIFGGPAGTIVSTPSPTASAQSAPFLQPSHLRASTAHSPVKGMTNVTLTWSVVPNAEKYRITVEGRSQPYETSATSLLVASVPAGQQYRMCVGTVYPYNLSQDASATCTGVKT